MNKHMMSFIYWFIAEEDCDSAVEEADPIFTVLSIMRVRIRAEVTQVREEGKAQKCNKFLKNMCWPVGRREEDKAQKMQPIPYKLFKVF